jgi:hypothetical protein
VVFPLPFVTESSIISCLQVVTGVLYVFVGIVGIGYAVGNNINIYYCKFHLCVYNVRCIEY